MTVSRLFIILSIAILSSCGMQEDRFRIEGQFKNLNQGEFYLYNFRNGTKDTLKINDGRFVYDVEMTDTQTFVLMFPNFSEIPIFAQPGSLVKIKGDVSHLKETEISGTNDNEQMTLFRLSTAELMPNEVKEQAGTYITDHAASQSSIYLLRRYFIQSVTPDYQRSLELCQLMKEAQPTNVELVQLEKQLKRLRNLRTDGRLPHFSATATNGKHLSDSLLKSKVNVIMTWASWNFDSQNAIRQLKMVYDEYPQDMSVLTICVDASQFEGRNIFAHDSLKWPNVCDGMMWDSPLMEQLGLTFVPDNIITDAQGNIKARSLKTTELRTKAKEMIE